MIRLTECIGISGPFQKSWGKMWGIAQGFLLYSKTGLLSKQSGLFTATLSMQEWVGPPSVIDVGVAEQTTSNKILPRV